MPRVDELQIPLLIQNSQEHRRVPPHFRVVAQKTVHVAEHPRRIRPERLGLVVHCDRRGPRRRRPTRREHRPPQRRIARILIVVAAYRYRFGGAGRRDKAINPAVSRRHQQD